MTPEAFRNLERGDMIRHRSGDGRAWLVDSVRGGSVTLVRTEEATNPDEWELAVKVVHVPIPPADEKTSGNR